MDVAAAKARLSAKKQQSQSMKVISTSQPMALEPIIERFSSPFPLIAPPSPPTSALPNKKLSFSAAAISPEEMPPVDDENMIASEENAFVPEVEADSGFATKDKPDKLSTATSEDPDMMQVFLRVRPMNETETKAGGAQVLFVEPPNRIRVAAPETSHAFKSGERNGNFTFTRVYDETVSQADLFSNIVANKTQAAIAQGRHTNIFAYGKRPHMDKVVALENRIIQLLNDAGMTNAGKTFTITGNDDYPGIVPRALASIFKNIEILTEGAGLKTLPEGVSVKDFVVAVSYLEIYQEHCFDLLSTAASATAGTGPRATALEFSRQPLQIKETAGSVYVKGLRHVTVSNAQTALEVMKEGANNKIVAETQLNADSSRSHTVFTISVYLRQRPDAVPKTEEGAFVQDIVDQLTGMTTPSFKLWSRINIVDLAGSERQSRTNSVGARLQEAGSINKSLMQLMMCFEAMRHNTLHPDAKKHVPSRDTKLTRLFASYFSGASMGSNVMIVNVGPAPADFDETLQALKYGALAKDIKIQKDRIANRWEGPQYDRHGRKVGANKEGDPEVVEEKAAAAKGRAKSVGHMRKPVPPPPIHGPQPTRKGSANDVLGHSDFRGKQSIMSNSSETSAISMSLVNAILSQPSADREEGLELDVGKEALEDLPLADAGQDYALWEAALTEKQEQWEQEKAELLESIHCLTRENETLAAELEDNAEVSAGIEAEVREAVAEEMAQRIAVVEEECKAKLTAQAAKFEERITKLVKSQGGAHEKLQLLPLGRAKGKASVASGRTSHAQSGRTSGTSRPSTFSEVDVDTDEARIEELTSQVAECEAEIERLRSQYASVTNSLRVELQAATSGRSNGEEDAALKELTAKNERLTANNKQLAAQLANARAENNQIMQELRVANETIADLRTLLDSSTTACATMEEELQTLRTIRANQVSPPKKVITSAKSPALLPALPPLPLSALPAGFTALTAHIEIPSQALRENGKRTRAAANASQTEQNGPRKRSRGNSVSGEASVTAVEDAKPSNLSGPAFGAAVATIRSPLEPKKASSNIESQPEIFVAKRATKNVPGSRVGATTASSRAKNVKAIEVALPTTTPIARRLRSRRAE